MTSVMLLSSGGLDSTTVGYWLLEQKLEVVPIFFDYGQHCAEKEWDTLKKVLPEDKFKPPERLNISDVFRTSHSRLIEEPNLWEDHVEDFDLYVPYRTLMLFAVGAACAQARGLLDVYSGFINSNHAKELDCSASFLNGLDELAEGVGAVRFKMPFRNWTKAQVISEAMRLTVPVGLTYSCQLLSDTPCGACPNCVERLNALTLVSSSK